MIIFPTIKPYFIFPFFRLFFWIFCDNKSIKVDRSFKIGYNIFMITNLEILNFLNLINERLGRAYRLSGKNPLPKNFSMDKNLLKERFYLNQMAEKINYPDFIYQEKEKIKNYFKNSIKNIKKIEKIIKNCDFSDEFLEKLQTYFEIRLEITKILIKEFKNQRFDEKDAYQEIYTLNPVLSNLMPELFSEHIDVKSLLDDLEKKYQLSYLEKLQIIEKKQQKKTQQKQLENVSLESDKNLQKSKKVEKTKQNLAKIEKNLKKNVKIKENKPDKEK